MQNAVYAICLSDGPPGLPAIGQAEQADAYESERSEPASPFSTTPDWTNFPSHLPRNALGSILAVLGVRPPGDAPLYWFRTEHAGILDGICADMKTDPASLFETLRKNAITAPNLRRVKDIHGLLAGVNNAG